MLKVQDLFVAYGGIEALKGISLEVPEGKIVTLIGANGAGKSTLLRTIVGLVKPKSGTISYNEQNITGLNSQKIVKTGITLVPEGRRVFPNLTVLENLQIGAYMRNDKEEIAKDIKWVYELFPRLEERSWQMAGTLSGGEQQMLAVGSSRNFGKESAIFAGLENAVGDACVIIDCDFQHPPETIIEMYKLWQTGDVDIVEAKKRTRGNESTAHRGMAKLFYKIIQRVSGLEMEDSCAGRAQRR